MRRRLVANTAFEHQDERIDSTRRLPDGLLRGLLLRNACESMHGELLDARVSQAQRLHKCWHPVGLQNELLIVSTAMRHHGKGTTRMCLRCR